MIVDKDISYISWTALHDIYAVRDYFTRFLVCCPDPLKSLGPIDRKFHRHGENDGFVLYEHIIKQFSSFCKHTNISDLKEKIVK